jgi:hypothetical protein
MGDETRGRCAEETIAGRERSHGFMRAILVAFFAAGLTSRDPGFPPISPQSG